MTQVINITVPIERLNIILEALGSQPFIRVVDTINDLRAQATAQLAQVNTQQPEEA